MKLSSFAIAAIAATTLLIPLSLAESAKAENCELEEKLAIFFKKDPERDRQSHLGRLSDYEKINNIYLEVLGREADRQAFITWTRELERYRTICDIRREIARSREAEFAINQLYQEVLGYEVDRKNLEVWQRVLARGASLQQVRQRLERYRDDMEKKRPNS